MSVKTEIERLKSVYETLKGDKEAKAIFEQAKELIEGFLKGKDKDIDVKLTGYADVDETIALAFKGQKVREAYVNRIKAVHFISSFLTLTAKYMPLVNEVAKAAKGVKKAAKKSLSRRKKKS